MATLPQLQPDVMHAGLPDMALSPPQMRPSQGQMPPSVTQPPQPPQQHQQPPQPPDPFDVAFNLMDPVLDFDAGDSFAEDYGVALQTGASLQGIPQKAVKQSFTLGIKNLSNMLSHGQYSDEYFGKSSQKILQDSADVFSSLNKYMNATSPKTQQAALAEYRDAIKLLPNVAKKITQLSNTTQQSHFLQDMQSSNDPTIMAILADAISQTDNGAAAFEYLITPKVPQGTPEPMMQRQSAVLFATLTKLIADSINQQLEALTVQAMAGMVRANALSATVQPGGLVDPIQLQNTVMQQQQLISQKISTIQQINNALFTPSTQAKIAQPQQHPLNKISINRYTNVR